MAKSKGKPKGKAKKTKSKVPATVGVLVGCLILIYFLSFAALLVMLGMLPTLVAIYVDQSKDHSHSKVIGACNVAGVLPFISDLLRQGITASNVHGILLSANAWVTMLGAAGLGWALVWAFPRGAYAALEYMQQNNISGLKKRQQLIIDEWGPDVETTASRALRNATYKDEKKNEGEAAKADNSMARLPAPKH